jgi:hypothetical protein
MGKDNSPTRPVKPAPYGTSPIKRTRRTQDQMDAVLHAIQNILDGEEGQITVRHLFYRLVGLRVVEKTEQAYKGLCSHLSKWRRSEQIPWSAFADNTRWHICHNTFDGIEDALRTTAETYRRNPPPAVLARGPGAGSRAWGCPRECSSSLTSDAWPCSACASHPRFWRYQSGCLGLQVAIRDAGAYARVGRLLNSRYSGRALGAWLGLRCRSVAFRASGFLRQSSSRAYTMPQGSAAEHCAFGRFR